MTTITDEEVREEESRIRNIGKQTIHGATVGGSAVIDGAKATGRGVKNLSKRVAASGVEGARATKRFIVSHAGAIGAFVWGFILFAVSVMFIVFQALFLMWLWVNFPIMFWAVVGVVGVGFVSNKMKDRNPVEAAA